MSHYEHPPIDPSDIAAVDDMNVARDFEILRAYQALLDNGASPEKLRESINRKGQELITLLADKKIYVNSEAIYTPIINEEALILNRINLLSGDAWGTAKSIAIEELPTGSHKEPVSQIAMTLHTGRIFISNNLLKGYFDTHVCCPVGSTVISLIEDRGSLLPSSDDEIVADIDEAIYNESINFARLAEIFQDPHKTTTAMGERDQPLQDMQLDVYLEYLNKNANFQHITALAPRAIKINGNKVQETRNQDPYLLDGKFAKFSIIKKTEDNEIGQKLIVCTSEDDGSLAGVYVEEILDIQLR